jgi:hypothetical protein
MNQAFPSRWMSRDGKRQVRYGHHETKDANNHHGHFEAYGPNGKVVENTCVDIIPD